MSVVYCPSCQLSFDEPLKRCPECHSNLKSLDRGKKVASVSGWQSPVSSAPEAAALPDTEDDWSTPYGSAKNKSTAQPTTLDSNEWDDWVDEEPEEAQGLSPTGTEYVGHLLGGSPPPPARLPWRALAILGLILALLCGLFLYRGYREREADKAAETVSAAPDYVVWLQSAEQSMADKDYELAAAQWKKGLDLLKSSDDDPAQLAAATKGLAQALTHTGDYEGAHQALRSLSQPPQAELKKLERSLRIQANDLLARAEKKPLEASDTRTMAKHALGFYEKYGGTKSQRAQALELIAKTYLAQRNSSAAAMALRRSLDLEHSTQRESLLSSLQLPGPPRPARSTRPAPAPQPRLDIKTGQRSVPLGERPGERYPVADSEAPDSIEPAPPQEQEARIEIDTSSEHDAPRPLPAPGNLPSGSTDVEDRHSSSKQDVLPTYTSGGRTNQRPPGY